MAKQGPGGISWTQQTWNPVRGCTRVSEGCRFCYAERVAARFSGPGQPYEELAMITPSGPRWTGKVRVVEEHLTDPLRWKRPRLIFVNSMSDLFHEALTFEQIDAVVAVMALARDHRFQVLTKRSARMREYLTELYQSTKRTRSMADLMHDFAPLDAATIGRLPYRPPLLSNVAWGVSAEDQKTLDERGADLMAAPGAGLKWLSLEPLLGSIVIPRGWRGLGHRHAGQADDPGLCCCGKPAAYHTRIEWVVVGGESGADARPMHPEWARSLRDQCEAGGMAFFFKQAGSVLGKEWGVKGKGGDPHEWPEEFRVQQFPDGFGVSGGSDRQRRLHHDPSLAA